MQFRLVSIICVIVTFLMCFSPKNDCLASGYQSTAFEILKKFQDSVRFNCTTDSKSSVDWQYQKTSDSKRVDIFIGNAKGGGGHKGSRYTSRNMYRIEMDIHLGRYDLLIDNITKTDEGFYECSDVSNPDSIRRWKLTVIGGEDEELCSNDVTALVSGTALLVFSTTKKDSIQLEHRSFDRSYPLHVYRDGRLVNEYFADSGRYGFSPSNNGSWNLAIKDVQMSDAGSFICSEDNGLGQQYVKELVVLRASDVACSTENETCKSELNITCQATYAGNCPPRLRLSTDGSSLSGNDNRVIITGNTVQLMTVAYRTHVPLCVVATQSLQPFNSACEVPVCNETSIEHVPYDYTKVGIIITSLILICLIVVIFVFVIKKRKILKSKFGECCYVRETTM